MPLPEKPDDDKPPVMIEVAQAMNGLLAEIIAGRLRASNIPVYVEQASALPSAVFGQSGMARIYVPEDLYEIALDLLEDDDELGTMLDEPGIQL